MRFYRWRAPAGIMALLLVGSCGTGADDAGVTTTTARPGITLTEWQQQTNAACEEFTPQVVAINEAQGPSETNDDLIALIEAVEPLAVQFRAALSAVEVPEERAEDVERAYELNRLQAAIVPQIITAASNDDEAALNEATLEYSVHDAEKLALIADLGATACVE